MVRARARKRKYEAGEVAKGETSAGVENDGPTQPEADSKRAGEPRQRRKQTRALRTDSGDSGSLARKESWHEASEDRWETACEKAKNEASSEQEEEARGHARRMRSVVDMTKSQSNWHSESDGT